MINLIKTTRIPILYDSISEKNILQKSFFFGLEVDIKPCKRNSQEISFEFLRLRSFQITIEFHAIGDFGTLGGSRLTRLNCHCLRSSGHAHITENIVFSW